MEVLAKLAVVVAVSTAWFWVNRRVFGDILSPFMLLLGSWVGPFFLRWFSLTHNERPWDESFTLISIFITVALVVPSLAARLFMPGTPKVNDGLIRRYAVLGAPKTHLFLTLLFIPTFAVFVHSNFITNPEGVVALAALRGIDYSAGNHKWGGEGIGIILTLPLLALAPIAHLSFRCSPKKGRRFIPLAIAWLPILGYLLKLSRNEAVAGMIYIGWAEFYFRRYLVSKQPTADKKHRPPLMRAAFIVSLVLSAGLVFNGMLKLREGYALQDRGGIAALIGFRPDLPPLIASPLAEFYGYYALPLQNFANFYSDYSGGYNPGVGFLRPLYSLTGQSAVAKQRIERIDYASYLDISAMNTKSFPAVLYAEGGHWALLIVPWLYSILVSAAYIRLRRRPTPTSVAHYALLCGYAWVWLFSTNGFVLLTVYIYLATVSAVGFVVRLRNYRASTWQQTRTSTSVAVSTTQRLLVR